MNNFELFLQRSSKSELVSFIRSAESSNRAQKKKSGRKTLQEYFESQDRDLSAPDTNESTAEEA